MIIKVWMVMTNKHRYFLKHSKSCRGNYDIYSNLLSNTFTGNGRNNESAESYICIYSRVLNGAKSREMGLFHE